MIDTMKSHYHTTLPAAAADMTCLHHCTCHGNHVCPVLGHGHYSCKHERAHCASSMGFNTRPILCYQEHCNVAAPRRLRRGYTYGNMNLPTAASRAGDYKYLAARPPSLGLYTNLASPLISTSRSDHCQVESTLIGSLAFGHHCAQH